MPSPDGNTIALMADVGSRNYYALALNADGTLKWAVNYTTSYAPSPRAIWHPDSSKIYIAWGGFRALNPANGATIWSSTAAVNYQPTLSSNGKIIYVNDVISVDVLF